MLWIQKRRIVFLGFCFGFLLGFVVILLLSPASTTTSAFIEIPEKTTTTNKIETKPHGSNLLEKVLCYIPIKSHTSEAIRRIKLTWGRFCDKLIFVSKEGNEKEGVIAHNYESVERLDLWNQVHRGWARVSERHLEEYDYFMKLDADSWFSPGNLVSAAHTRKWSPDSLAYYGHTLFEQSRPIEQSRSQFNLGSGYGVTRGLLRVISPYFSTINNSHVPLKDRCPDWVRWGEDVKFADCIRHVIPSFIPNVTRDDWGRENFLPFEPYFHFFMPVGENVKWFWRGKTCL